MEGEEAPADDFRDLRDDGVAEGGKAVHSGGNPISHSTHVGFRFPPSPSASATWPSRCPFDSRVA